VVTIELSSIGNTTANRDPMRFLVLADRTCRQPNLATPDRLAVDSEDSHAGSALARRSFDGPRQAEDPFMKVVERANARPRLLLSTQAD
jgi:hypothetical protein